jgi:hypothetical protein
MQRLEVSGAVQPIYGSFGVKGLTIAFYIVIRDLVILNIQLYMSTVTSLKMHHLHDPKHVA